MSKKSPPTRPPGRASTYTQKIADEICERIATGETLADVCRRDNMPAYRTVSDWKEAHETFAAAYARAREEGFDRIAESCLEIADDATNDYMLKKEGETDGRFDSEHVQRSKLRIETRLKLLAKWDPKRYGEKLAIGGAADLPPLQTMSDNDLALKIAALQASNAKQE